MNIFEFLFYLGIIHIIFGFIWKWTLLLPALLLALVNFPDGIKIVKIFGSYLLILELSEIIRRQWSFLAMLKCQDRHFN